MKKTTFLFSIIAIQIFANCSTTKSQARDGLTFETSIKVRSVDEEYQLLPKLCPNCRLQSQGLTSKGNRHYDVMEMKKSTGETVNYYFDITSFYGDF